MKNNIKSICNDLNRVSTLSIKAVQEEKDNDLEATLSCRRFIHIADILPLGSYIGWSFDVKSFTGVTFSNKGLKITAKDFKWAFNECADTELIPVNAEMVQYEEGKNTYALYPAEDNKDERMFFEREFGGDYYDYYYYMMWGCRINKF